MGHSVVQGEDIRMGKESVSSVFGWMYKKHVWFMLLFLVVILTGFISVQYTWVTSMDATSQTAVQLAESAAAGFSEEVWTGLEAGAKDLEKPEYRQIKNSLMKLTAINPDVHFAYLYTQKNGKIYLMVDSEAPDSEDYSPPGQEFTEAAEIFFKPFEEGRPVITQPTTDRWGTWVSVLIPLVDSETGEIGAVFGMDYSAKEWSQHATIRTAQMVFVILCVLLLLSAIHVILIQNMHLKNEKTKLRQVNEEIEKAKNSLSKAQAMTLVGSWEVDISSDQVWVSDEVYRIFGVEQLDSGVPPEILYETVRIEDMPRLELAMRHLLENNEKFDVVFRIRHMKSGEERIIHASAALEFDQEEKPYKVIGVVQDITERTLAEEKLRERGELFRTLYEQSPLGITFGNFNREIIDANPMFEKMVGRTTEELIRIGWVSITHPDDLQEDLDQFERLKNGEISQYSMIKRYLKPDGTAVWVNMTVAPLHVTNKSNLSHLCIVEDISDRIRAMQELRESERSKSVLLSNLPGMAYRCSFDRDWTMHFVSDGCYELTGYRPESLLENAEISFNQLISEEYRSKLWDLWTETIRDKTVFRQEYPIITASGELKWVFEQGRGIYNENGNVEALEGLIIDITDRKKREDEIEYLSRYDVLTNLYNRRWVEEEKKRVDQESQLPLSVIIGDINGLKLINDALGHAEGDRLIVETAKIIRSCFRESYILARTGGDEFSILLPKTDSNTAYALLKKVQAACEAYNKRNAPNETCYINISLGYATKKTMEENLNSVVKTAEDYMYKRKLLEQKSLRSAIISSIKTTMFEKSQETEEHAERLTVLSKAVGKKLNLSPIELDELELLATLHDIGKVGIDDQILKKNGKLTNDEWVQMRRHPEIGYRIAMASPELMSVAEYILCHHEWWNGKGYPQGLKGEEIPLLSRIIAVVDAYDAMTQDRPYKKAMSKEAAAAEIAKGAGTQFDPKIAKILLEMNQ